MVLTNDRSPDRRVNVTLLVSRDGGNTWPDSSAVTIWPGAAGYTDVAAMPLAPGSAAVVFENATCSVSVAIVSEAF